MQILGPWLGEWMVGHETISHNLIRAARVSVVKPKTSMKPLEAIKVCWPPPTKRKTVTWKHCN